MYPLLWLVVLTELVTAQRITTNGRCGPSFGGSTCKGSAWGSCCSRYSWCGVTSDHCRIDKGCVSAFGACEGSGPVLSVKSSTTLSSTRRATPSAPASSFVPATALRISYNARCGYLNGASPGGMTCSGSIHGNCCSQWSFCGNSDAYCGVGCQSGFSLNGSCKNIPSQSSASPRSSTFTTPTSSSRSSQPQFTGSITTSGIETRQSIISKLSSEMISVSLSSISGTASNSQSTFIDTSIIPSTSSSTPILSSSSIAEASSSSSILIDVASSSSSSFSSSVIVALVSTSSIDLPSTISSSSAIITSATDSQLSSLSIDLLTGSLSSSSISMNTEATIAVSSSSSQSLPLTETPPSTSIGPASSIISSVSSSTSQEPRIELSTSIPGIAQTSTSIASTSLITMESQLLSLSSTLNSESTSVVASSSTMISSETQFTTSSVSPSLESSSASSSLSSNEIVSLPLTTTDMSGNVAASTSSLSGTVTSFYTETSVSVSTSSIALSSSTPEADCNPPPTPTCNKAQDCPVSSNAVVAPSSTYGMSGLVFSTTGVPAKKQPIPITNLDVGTDYVLTFYGAGTSLGSGSNSCCNLTAYIDDVIVSQYCVGFYWSYNAFNYRHGPFVGPYSPRSPAVVYRPQVPNPRLEFAIHCPVPNNMGISPGGSSLYAVSLVPRCACREEDKVPSVKLNPFNRAFNGNFADFDLQQENPITGWVSEENWKNQVTPVQSLGIGVPDDKSNNGSVVLHGAKAAIHRTITHLNPTAMYNVSLLYQNGYNLPECRLVVKFNDNEIINLPRIDAGLARSKPMSRIWTTFVPNTSTGILWIGSVCTRDYDGVTQISNFYPTIRIDDVIFTKQMLDGEAPSCGNSAGSVSSTSPEQTPPIS